MTDKIVTIIIPIYKEHITENESVSLSKAIEVFDVRPIVFVAPEGLDITFYEILLNQKHNNFSFKYFPKEYFRSIESYNKLMLSHNFYSQFLYTEYILIYQLDAYVFYDELVYWSNTGYDYLGAPWISNKSNGFLIEKFAGNGGFSLRKISSFTRTLEIRRLIVLNPFQVFKEYSNLGVKKILRKAPLIIARFFGFRNNTRFYFKTNSKKEDVFWAYIAPKINKNFKSIKGVDAIGFAFDEYPSFLYKINNNKLPFGCHGWTKNESTFWCRFIPKNE